jgi:hypothetical protein
MIELGIAAVASCNPDLKVLTQNLRLPVLPEALQVVELNDAAELSGVDVRFRYGRSQDLHARLCHSQSVTKHAHVIDAKRSVYTYDRAADLTTCKTA